MCELSVASEIHAGLYLFLEKIKQNEAQSACADSTHKGVNTLLSDPGESYHRQLRSLLLYLCYVFWALINSFVCLFLDQKSPLFYQ